MRDTDIFRKAIEHWGEDAQVRQFFEEAGEAITAVSHYKRGRNTIEELLGELADLEILLVQMSMIFDQDPERQLTHDIYAEKVEQLKDKLGLD